MRERASKSLLAALALSAAALAGCASLLGPNSIAPGASAGDIRARYGAPTDERTLAGGQRAWDYVQGPQGFQTYRIVFDGDRVQRVEPLLTERNFIANIKAGETGRDDVLRAFGRPGSRITFPNLQDEVWTYRYRDVTMEMLNDVHISTATGKVTYYALYRDPAYANAIDSP